MRYVFFPVRGPQRFKQMHCNVFPETKKLHIINMNAKAKNNKLTV